ncbi:spermidine synthase, partial [Chloroflexota bacterium]
LNPILLSVAEVDNRLLARPLTGLKFYDGITHQGMFSLPKHLRDEISRQKRLITDNEPLYIYRG